MLGKAIFPSYSTCSLYQNPNHTAPTQAAASSTILHKTIIPAISVTSLSCFIISKVSLCHVKSVTTDR